MVSSYLGPSDYQEDRVLNPSLIFFIDKDAIQSNPSHFFASFDHFIANLVHVNSLDHMERTIYWSYKWSAYCRKFISSRMKIGLWLLCKGFNLLLLDFSHSNFCSWNPLITNKRFCVQNNDVCSINSVSIAC